VADRIEPKTDTLTNWLASSNIPTLNELCVAVDGSGVVLFGFYGDGSSDPSTLIAAKLRMLAPLRAPEFVGGLTALDEHSFFASASGKGVRIGGASAAFTHQRLLVDGRVSSRARALRAHRASNSTQNAGPSNSPAIVTWDTISSGFNSTDLIDSVSWLDLTNGRFTPLIPGLWRIAANLSLTSTYATGTLLPQILKNGSLYSYGQADHYGQGGGTWTYRVRVDDLVLFNGSTDYAQVAVDYSTFNGSLTYQGGAEQTYLLLQYLGFTDTAPT